MTQSFSNVFRALLAISCLRRVLHWTARGSHRFTAWPFDPHRPELHYIHGRSRLIDALDRTARPASKRWIEN